VLAFDVEPVPGAGPAQTGRDAWSLAPGQLWRTTLFNALQLKALELWNRFDRNMEKLAETESGQTSSEYVAVTAVAVAIAIGVIYLTLRNALSTAVSNIGTAITNFVSNNV
jgi:Flp pilus assembly pilin Flp